MLDDTVRGLSHNAHFEVKSIRVGSQARCTHRKTFPAVPFFLTVPPEASARLKRTSWSNKGDSSDESLAENSDATCGTRQEALVKAAALDMVGTTGCAAWVRHAHGKVGRCNKYSKEQRCPYNFEPRENAAKVALSAQSVVPARQGCPDKRRAEALRAEGAADAREGNDHPLPSSRLTPEAEGAQEA
eukprot:6173414-Pleurochrysis_carterae.AAC.2